MWGCQPAGLKSREHPGLPRANCWDKTCSTKGPLVSILEVFIGGRGVTLAFHPAVWKRAGPGAVSDLIPQTWHGLPSSEMSP